MKNTTFENLALLLEACVELRKWLVVAREAMTDEAWDAMCDGPAGEILCAAMDVEYYVEKCNE